MKCPSGLRSTPGKCVYRKLYREFESLLHRLRDNKIVRAARDDAASFVATDGAIRGVKLESAFAHIRQQAPQLQASDAQLAQAILAI